MYSSIPNGVWPTMITPFTNDNRIDYDAVERLMDWYGNNGVAGVFAICQSSEIFFMSQQEKLELLQFIVSHNPHKLPIIASGHTADSPQQQIDEAKRSCDTGIAAYVLISNRFELNGINQDDFKRGIEQFVAAVPNVPLGIYECPSPYKRLLEPELLRWCAATKRFIFMKDTCCDSRQIAQKLAAVDGTGFKLFNANAATLLQSLQDGAAGYSGIMANFHPDLYVWLCRHYQEQLDEAAKLAEFLAISSMVESQTYPVSAKYYLDRQGVTMSLHTRAKDAKDFSFGQRAIVQQLASMSQRYRSI